MTLDKKENRDFLTLKINFLSQLVVKIFNKKIFASVSSLDMTVMMMPNKALIKVAEICC